MAATAGELLERARDRVAQGWTQGAEARTAAGDPVDPWRGEAVAWSLLGTIVASYDELAHRHADFGLEQLAIALHRLAPQVDEDSLVVWNDAPERTQEDAVGVLEEALRADEREPPLFVYSAN